jgi:hypothetical protein
MYGFAGLSRAVGPAAALEDQVRRLSALLEGIDATRSHLPVASDGIWRGPAHTVYTAALAALVRELSDVRGQLEHALAGSRSALGVLASRD